MPGAPANARSEEELCHPAGERVQRFRVHLTAGRTGLRAYKGRPQPARRGSKPSSSAERGWVSSCGPSSLPDPLPALSQSFLRGFHTRYLPGILGRGFRFSH
ncbi:unnamed protein product [Rangifer tarandus platyrhynchus]|uniref:Uncharacterized protein n=1 Tax=Rangifer tarandus platyrhynchus TaxID=3082113 RepID=A0ACB1MLA4_RANTA